MNSSLYLMRELAFRRGRSIATATSIALSGLIAVLLTALASTFAGALKVLKSVGADVVVQLSGDIPKKLEGLDAVALSTKSAAKRATTPARINPNVSERNSTLSSASRNDNSL